jgi:hypothetical protein
MDLLQCGGGAGRGVGILVLESLAEGRGRGLRPRAGQAQRLGGGLADLEIVIDLRPL